MLSSRTLAPLAVLLAVAVGYLAGMVRPGSQSGTATAGPTPMNGANIPYLTSSADGTELYVWQLKDGSPASAARYRFWVTNHRESDGTTIWEHGIDVRSAAVPAPDTKAK